MTTVKQYGERSIMASKSKAKKPANKKKKMNFVQRMMFGDDDKPDITPEQSKLSKWGMFKELFFHRFGTMVALNLLTCIFALPAVAVIFLFYMNIRVNSGLIPYSGNIGIGYPVVTDAMTRGQFAEFTYNLMQYALLVPCISVFGLGVSGNLYVMRKLIWGEPTSTFKDFFRGIKKCWLCALLTGLAVGFSIMLFTFSLGYFDVYGLSVAYKVLSIIFSSILLVFVSLMAAFILTQNAAFKMRATVLIRNSALFVFGTHILSIFFVGIAVAPAFLAFIPGITMLLSMLYLFIGFSFTTLVISLYCHYCYERFLYDKIENRPSAAYSKRPSDIEEQREKDQPNNQPNKPKKPAQYKNPKKRKKSIDEGSDITPLTPTFRREDLERLEREHERVMSESDDSYIDGELGELDGDDADPKSDADKT